MKLVYRFDPDLNTLIRHIEGDVKKIRRFGMLNVVTTIEALAIKKAPVKSSNLANSGTSNVSADGGIGTISFIARNAKGDPYGLYVHEGTGIYGPKRRPIFPTTKKALWWPGAKHPVKFVSGMRARPFLKKAAEEVDIPAVFIAGANRR
jgi:hypothetical protein